MKTIILSAIILLIAGTVSAQTYLNSDRDNLNSVSQPNVAFEAGAAISSTTSGTNFNTGSLAGFNVGFSFDLPVFNTFSIMPEILYAQKGYTANTQFGNFEQRSQYIDIPVLAKFNTGSKLNFYVGPQVSYLMTSTNRFSSGFSAPAQGYYENNGSKLLFDGVVGAGINVTHSVELHARYAVSLQGSYTNGSTIVPSYRNQALQIGFGFKLN